MFSRNTLELDPYDGNLPDYLVSLLASTLFVLPALATFLPALTTIASGILLILYTLQLTPPQLHPTHLQRYPFRSRWRVRLPDQRIYCHWACDRWQGVGAVRGIVRGGVSGQWGRVCRTGGLDGEGVDVDWEGASCAD